MATDPATLLENIRKPLEMAKKTSRPQIIQQNLKRIRQWIMELAPQLPAEKRHCWARLVQAIDRGKPLAEIYGMLEEALSENGSPPQDATSAPEGMKTSRRAVSTRVVSTRVVATRVVSTRVALAKYHLDTPLQYIKGVGPRKARILERVGLKQLEDLLYYFPRDYEDRRRTWRIEELSAGSPATIMVRVLQTELARLPGRRSLLTVVATDGSGSILLKWWNQPYLEERLAQGAMLLVSGRVNKFQGRLEINSPEYELAEHFDGINYDRIVPIYPLTEGLTQKALRRLTYLAMESSESLPEILPNEVLAAEKFPPIYQAIRKLHFPDELTDTELARRRLAYQELFLLQVGLTLRRRRLRRELGVSLDFSGKLRDELLASLPFQPTDAQMRVLAEIEEDLRSPYPMNRLIQGDVGSGKTLTALLAILDTVECGAQAVLMAPTEILARQHYANISEMLSPLGKKPVLLVGSQEPGERTEALTELATGEATLAVGTHALFSERIAFRKLGLVVIDEQHRFGVYQRAALVAKGKGPNLLVMTATPIPRTLAMALYGDLDLSVIDQMPPGRGTITTRVFEFDRHNEVLELVRAQVLAGRQAFFVYPLVEESQKLDVRAATQMYKYLATGPLSNFRLGLVHGQMPRKEQDNVMTAFRRGEIDILVSTTVTEVGIDVANATAMVVENAERFGLSQLHQLRGRIGRGKENSYCLLVLAEDAPDTSRERVEVLTATTDGFRIAEEDLRLRGPGEYLGSRQSGIPDFTLAVLLSYPDLIVKAKEQAEALVSADPKLLQEQHRNLKRRLLSVYADKLDIVLSG